MVDIVGMHQIGEVATDQCLRFVAQDLVDGRRDVGDRSGCVEDADGIGRVLDERAKARLALGEYFAGAVGLRDELGDSPRDERGGDADDRGERDAPRRCSASSRTTTAGAENSAAPSTIIRARP